MNDIVDKDDVEVFVDAFYFKVRKDELLGPVFASKITDWEPHLERMYSFWNTVLFAKQDYRGNPFSKHARLPIHKLHFNRWIELLTLTIDEKFKGEKADEVKYRANMMGRLFSDKLDHIRTNNQFKNII